MQIIGIIAGIAAVYFATYQPKIVQYRAQNNIYGIKHLYLKSCLLLLITYIFCGTGFLFLGDWALTLIGSKTPLLHKSFIAAALVIAFLESNHSIAGGFLLTKNEVPFFKAAITPNSV
jgi:O-antigen/teichoic acid export membrane protein